jgi:hypothetical protein
MPIILFLLLGGIGLVALSRHSQTSGTNTNKGLPPNIPSLDQVRQAVANALAHETDPSKLRAFANSLPQPGMEAEKAALLTKASAIEVAGAAVATPPVMPTPPIPIPSTGSDAGNAGNVGNPPISIGNIGNILGNLGNLSVNPPMTSSMPVGIPSQANDVMFADLPKLPPIPSAGKVRTGAHKQFQQAIVNWAQSTGLAGETYDTSQIDGIIGPVTQRVSQRYQRWHNRMKPGSHVVEDGLPGAQTMSALSSDGFLGGA